MGLKYTETVSEVVTIAPVLAGDTNLLPLYENSTQYSAAFKYTNIDPLTLLETELEIQLISYSGPNGFSATQTSNKIVTISGMTQQVFLDAYYQFVMPDGSIEILPANTTKEFAALIKWSPPATKSTTVTHSLTLLIKADPILGTPQSQQTFSLQQTVYWKYQQSLANFQNLLSRGTL
jgi:hypothetical protein